MAFVGVVRILGGNCYYLPSLHTAREDGGLPRKDFALRSPSRPNSSTYRRRRGTSLAAAALSFALVAPLAQSVAFADESGNLTEINGVDSGMYVADAPYASTEEAELDTDGDGISDAQELEAGTDPQDENSAPTTIEPIQDKYLTVGARIPNIPVVVHNQPTGATIEIDNLPSPLTFDAERSEIIGGDGFASFADVTVRVVGKNGQPIIGADGQPVTTTFAIVMEEPPVASYEMADEYTVHPKSLVVEVGQDVRPEDLIENVSDLPYGTEFEFVRPVDTSTAGSQDVEVRVRYSDYSESTVVAEVTVQAPPEPEPLRVDSSGTKVLDPWEEKQGTGVMLFNWSDQTSVEATDEDLMDYPAEINPSTGEIEVTLYSNADGPIIMAIHDPSLPDGKAVVEAPVSGHEKGRDDNESDYSPSLAELYSPEGRSQQVDTGSTLDPKNNVNDADTLPDGTMFEYKEIPDTSRPGDHDVTVIVTYPDGSQSEVGATVAVRTVVEVTPVTPQNPTIIVKPKPSPSEPTADRPESSTSKYTLVYPVSYVRAGEKGTSIRPNVTVNDDGFDFTRQPMPKGAKFSTDYKGANFDEHGALTITAPEGVDEVVVPVTVTFADGTTATTNAKFIVRANDAAQNYAPAYELGVNASPGETVLVHQTGEESLPAGTEFELDRKQSELNGWVVRVNPETGVIEATAPQGNEAKRATLAVKVSYFDGSEQTIKATVDPGSTPSMAAKLTPTKTTLEVDRGDVDSGSVFKGAPEGTKFRLLRGVDGSGWDVDVDEDTGQLTVKTDDTVKPNETRSVPVEVTLPDGSRKEVDITVKAVEAGASTPAGPAQPKGPNTNGSSGSSASAGSIVAIVVGVLALIGGVGWALKMNEPQVRKVLRDMGIHI